MTVGSAGTHRVSIIGSGPAGFYAAHQLLTTGFEVDLFDALPTPFGLVRAGVAPDHPKIKSVTRIFAKTARHQGFRFFGGIALGRDISRLELLDRYHAVVYAVGSATGKRMGIPGEERTGSYLATEFVAWYNGHPAFADREFDLSARRAVVVGNGNVAIDVARMLVLHPDEVAATDTADHAIQALATAGVREVVVLGRRGPAQAAFTNPELRELGELSDADVVVDAAEVELDPHRGAWLESANADPTKRRNVEILRDYARRERSGKRQTIEFKFLRSPLELLGDSSSGRVAGLRVSRNRLEVDERGRLRALPTGEEETIECGLVLCSIGYRGLPLSGVPFDERHGRIRNDGGRVCREDGEPLRGEYCAGWIKRGPSGVIGTNKKDAAETVAHIVEDASVGALNKPLDADRNAVGVWLAERVPGVIRWDGWEAIDRHETRLGQPFGRSRVKLVRVHEMIEIAAATPPEQ